jgi:competence protein ComFC
MRLLKPVLSGARLVARSGLAVLVPQLCVACDRVISSSHHWLCHECAREFTSGAAVRSRFVKLADGQYLRVRYALDYTVRVSKVIAEMKYGDKPGIASLLAPYLRTLVGAYVADDSVLVPVPMFPAKKRERGYNQSEILSSLLSKSSGVACLDRLLVKTRDTVAQAVLEKEARSENVAGSFAIRHDRAVTAARVILVDDVVTTGSTLRACAEAMRTAYEGNISACVVASSR